MAIGPVTGCPDLLLVAIGPVVFDIRYITNDYTKICGLRNLVSTEEHLSINTQKSEYIPLLYHLGCTADAKKWLQLTILILYCK